MLYPAWLAVILTFMALPAAAQDAPGFTVLHASGDDAMSDGRILLAFWRSDCPPCVAEQPILKAIAKKYPSLKVALISLQGDAYAQRHAPIPSEPNMEVWVSKQDADTTLLEMGDIRRALPFSVFLSKDGSTCKTHQGLLGTDLADEWMKQC